MYRIKQASELSGFSIDTLRFYDKESIAQPSMRSESGYRLYTEDDLSRLRFIRRAKALGFSLKSVQELLELRLNREARVCQDVKTVAEQKLLEVREKMAQLQQFEKALARLHDSCCGGEEPARDCTILQALESVEDEPCR